MRTKIKNNKNCPGCNHSMKHHHKNIHKQWYCTAEGCPNWLECNRHIKFIAGEDLRAGDMIRVDSESGKVFKINDIQKLPTNRGSAKKKDRNIGSSRTSRSSNSKASPIKKRTKN